MRHGPMMTGVATSHTAIIARLVPIRKVLERLVKARTVDCLGLRKAVSSFAKERAKSEELMKIAKAFYTKR